MIENNNKWKIVSWSVIAGIVIALSAEITFNFLGLGIGLINTNINSDSLYKMGIGSIIWIIISSILTMGLGGWIAGKILNHSCCKVRVLHGVLAWSFTTIIIVAVSTTAAGAMFGGTASLVKSGINTVAEKPITSIAKYAMSSDIDNAKEHVEAATEKTTDYLGGASITIFVAFLLSAIASMLGAFLAKPETVET